MKSGKNRKKSKLIFRIVCAAVVLAIVIMFVLAAVRSKGDISVRNVLSNITSLWSRDSIAEEIDYERCRAACKLGNGIATVSENGIRTIGADNDEELLNSFTMSDPYLESNGELALTCDIGKNTLKIFRLNSIVYELETENPIISAHMNSSGWFAVCTRETGYTSSVTVYNAKGTAVYRWYSGEGYILSARVAEGNKSMAVLVLDRSGSELIWFKLNSEEEQRRFTLENRTILDFAFVDGGKTAAITADGLLFINERGAASEYDFSEYDLACYDLQKKTTVIGLWSNKFGTAGKVVAVRSDGNETGTVELDGKITDISWSGDMCAVLTENGVKTYKTAALNEAKSFDGISGRKVIAQKDGSVLVTGDYMTKHLK